VILTIGHSNRTLEAFLQLLKVHGVKRVLDVRTIPRSRHNPQFNGDTLPTALKRSRIGYTHVTRLGGLRHATKESLNTGWRNASFRGFADYMQTADFEKGLNQSVKRATREQVALMCAEAVPWRCHRSLIADALTIRGIPVEHIMSGRRAQRHTLTPFAKVRGLRLTYPSDKAPEATEKTRRAPLSSSA
jgi:uncharacterized protein (DUF488 family)